MSTRRTTKTAPTAQDAKEIQQNSVEQADIKQALEESKANPATETDTQNECKCSCSKDEECTCMSSPETPLVGDNVIPWGKFADELQEVLGLSTTVRNRITMDQLKNAVTLCKRYELHKKTAPTSAYPETAIQLSNKSFNMIMSQLSEIQAQMVGLDSRVAEIENWAKDNNCNLAILRQNIRIIMSDMNKFRIPKKDMKKLRKMINSVINETLGKWFMRPRRPM